MFAKCVQTVSSTFVLRACFYVFERENVYFPDPTGVSRTNLLKSLLHVIETSCMVNCAGTFRSKNPGLIRKQCKAGPFEIRQQRSCLAHLSVKKISYWHVFRTYIAFVLYLNYICPHLSWVQIHHYPIYPRDNITFVLPLNIDNVTNILFGLYLSAICVWLKSNFTQWY